MTAKELKKILNQAAFNPKKLTGPLKVIMESGDSNYFETRAIELVKEAKDLIPNTQVVTDHIAELYHDKINKAISLLALARLYRMEGK